MKTSKKTLSNAQKQRKYRQRQALKRACNGYAVTLLKQECDRLNNTTLLPELLDLAEEVYDLGGKGNLFLERVAILCYAYLLTAEAAGQLMQPNLSSKETT